MLRWLSLPGFLVVALVACSSTENKPAPAPVADGGTTPPAATGKCAGEATAQGCRTCCGFTKEAGEAYTKPFETCACKEICKTACATTICAGGDVEPSADCEECLGGVDATVTCAPEAVDSCELNAACKAFTKCDSESLCQDKQ